jgi:hypothetical protein
LPRVPSTVTCRNQTRNQEVRKKKKEEEKEKKEEEEEDNHNNKGEKDKGATLLFSFILFVLHFGSWTWRRLDGEKPGPGPRCRSVSGRRGGPESPLALVPAVAAAVGRQRVHRRQLRLGNRNGRGSGVVVLLLVILVCLGLASASSAGGAGSAGGARSPGTWMRPEAGVDARACQRLAMSSSDAWSQMATSGGQGQLATRAACSWVMTIVKAGWTFGMYLVQFSLAHCHQEGCHGELVTLLQYPGLGEVYQGSENLLHYRNAERRRRWSAG